MRRRRRSSRRGAAAIGLQLGGISIACAALLAGYAPANAQVLDPAPTKKPQAKPEVGPQPDPNAPRKTPARRRTKTKPKLRSTRILTNGLIIEESVSRKGLKRKRPARTSFAANPNAKWVCDNQTVVRESIWRGRSTLTYEFFIHNAGTADLKIKATGG